MSSADANTDAKDEPIYLLDVNVLLALVSSNHVRHALALEHFSALNGRWATCAITEAGLVRLLLTPAVMGREIRGGEALGLLEAMRGLPGWVWLSVDTPLASAQIDWRVLSGRNQVTDLQLLEIAAVHGARLCTFDAKIKRFLAPDDLQWLEIWS
ncbi:MAG: PIN domain-containing protein [Arcanobacterium sp.]|nr:PIN domain-containing protein [Arcanobacterium sp.]MDY5588834.1 TA system VapC family ribonuclease toxin [Arcanobacterium sp.]